MFEHLLPLPQDPMLSMLADYRADTHPHKLDLGIGVYKDEQGNTPIMRAVKEAENHLLRAEQSKSYTAPAGTAEYNHLASTLVFGTEHPALKSSQHKPREAAVLCEWVLNSSTAAARRAASG